MTAELAVALPGVVLVLAVLLLVGSAGLVQLRCADGARAGARQAAIGVPDAQVVAVARRVAGDQVAVAIERDGQWATVRVDGAVADGWLGPGLAVAASATAWVEP